MCAGQRKTPRRLTPTGGFVYSKRPLRRAGNDDDQYYDGDYDLVHEPTIADKNLGWLGRRRRTDVFGCWPDDPIVFALLDDVRGPTKRARGGE